MVVHDVYGVYFGDILLGVDPKGLPGGAPVGQDGRVALGARAGGQVHLGSWVRTEDRGQSTGHRYSAGKQCNYSF